MPHRTLDYSVHYAEGSFTGPDDISLLRDFSDVLTRYGVPIPEGEPDEGRLRKAINEAGQQNKITFNLGD